MIRILIIAAAVLALAACGEKPQTANGVKSDTAAFQGTGLPYVAPGWKPGSDWSACGSWMACARWSMAGPARRLARRCLAAWRMS